ncbi:hypothetical protein HPO96_35040 [Kribbella sandramycini]|uniref:Uncharacterized protein n=1 Tax=Kribbella sandramycini TaxID=60450 RepID=A0A7Y4L8W2_9ACTN|nr:hypothetical protein [Kribbella sandramycini]MBB6566689.1 hypothetical protein [Kribbella sandramycini]NOL45477.1 hypothetical protein [Kribbella sandramycini]
MVRAGERPAALRRARERQARIETATGRTVKAFADVARARSAKAAAVERCDARISAAEAAAESETAEFVKVCGSAEAVAEILGMSAREVRRAIKAVRERQGSS